MPDWPDNVVPPLGISTVTKYGVVDALALVGATSAAYVWPVANQACYVPVSIPFYFPVKHVWWANGSVVTANMDFGIYTLDGTRLYSTGSTAQSGASAVQRVAPATPFLLTPGSYYFALACSLATAANAFGISTVTTNEGRLTGCLQQATALPLPAAATFAQWASTGLPFCGISRI